MLYKLNTENIYDDRILIKYLILNFNKYIAKQYYVYIEL